VVVGCGLENRCKWTIRGWGVIQGACANALVCISLLSLFRGYY